MALNVKVAMLACMGFVAALSWMVSGAEMPQRTYRSPLIASGAGTPLTLAGIGEDESHAVLPLRPAQGPRFAHPNVFERELAATGEPAPLNVVGSAGPPREFERALPPLVVDPPAAVPDSATLAAHRPLSERSASPADDGQVLLVGAEPPDEEPAAPAACPAVRTYRVARGDTLVRILRREWNTVDPRLIELVVALNPDLRGRADRILVGETLILPGAAAAADVLAGERGPRELAAALREAEAETGAFRWYTIQRNDSLTGIAQRLLNDSSRWREILELNRQLDPNRIFPGDRIKLPLVGVRVASS